MEAILFHALYINPTRSMSRHLSVLDTEYVCFLTQGNC